MFNPKSLVPGALLAATLSLPLTAHAAQPGLYLGVGLGSADDVILDETSAASKVFAGINLNRFLGMEVSYVNLGDYVNGAITQDGVAYEVVGHLPLSPYVDVFGKVEMDFPRAVVMMCGPEGMMQVAVDHLLERGVREDSLHLSMERSMNCAVGLCGHCQYGGKFVCRDGPVFSYSEVKPLFGIRGF